MSWSWHLRRAAILRTTLSAVSLNFFSAALDTRSIDTAAISYSPFESSWPCFEKPGNGFFGPDMLITNANWLSSGGRKKPDAQAAGFVVILVPECQRCSTAGKRV